MALDFWVFKLPFWNCYQKCSWPFWLESWVRQVAPKILTCPSRYATRRIRIRIMCHVKLSTSFLCSLGYWNYKLRNVTDDGGGGSGNSTDDGCNKLSDLQVWSLAHYFPVSFFVKYCRFTWRANPWPLNRKNTGGLFSYVSHSNYRWAV